MSRTAELEGNMVIAQGQGEDPVRRIVPVVGIYVVDVDLIVHVESASGTVD